MLLMTTMKKKRIGKIGNPNLKKRKGGNRRQTQVNHHFGDHRLPNPQLHHKQHHRPNNALPGLQQVGKLAAHPDQDPARDFPHQTGKKDADDRKFPEQIPPPRKVKWHLREQERHHRNGNPKEA
jgi:hypothetical protein